MATDAQGGGEEKDRGWGGARGSEGGRPARGINEESFPSERLS